jgi:hypothetical protein
MSAPKLPAPPSEPDDGRNPTWEPTEFPATVAGEIASRTTLKFRQPRGERETFEKLVIQSDGELIDVLCGRARLARLVVKHDPQPGDLISVRAFGPDPNGWHEYGMNVDKSPRLANRAGSALDGEPSAAAKASRALNEPLPLGDEVAAS